MKIQSLIVGVLVVVVAAIVFADGVLGFTNTGVQLLSLRGLKLAVGFALVVLAASYFQRTKE